jgi:two-component system invasion response regulator UvrY
LGGKSVINILVADDHAVVRRGVREILDEADGLQVGGEASTVKEVVQLVRSEDFDVIVLDIKMPDGSGLDALKQIRQLKPATKVCILSIYPEQQYAIRAFRSGASGYLTKESAADELLEAIHRIAAGGKSVSRTLAITLADELTRETPAELHELLSDREYQVLCAIAEGKPVKQIAESYSLSVKTVSTYRSRMMNKMGFKSTAEVIRYAVEKGLAQG